MRQLGNSFGVSTNDLFNLSMALTVWNNVYITDKMRDNRPGRVEDLYPKVWDTVMVKYTLRRLQASLSLQAELPAACLMFEAVFRVGKVRDVIANRESKNAESKKSCCHCGPLMYLVRILTDEWSRDFRWDESFA